MEYVVFIGNLVISTGDVLIFIGKLVISTGDVLIFIGKLVISTGDVLSIQHVIQYYIIPVRDTLNNIQMQIYDVIHGKIPWYVLIHSHI